METFALYQQYSRAEVVSRLATSGDVQEYSNGELVTTGSMGALLGEIGRPPYQSYCLSREVFCWMSFEIARQFYNEQILSFQSRFRSDGKPLHFFGKTLPEHHYIYLGTLKVVSGEVPGRDRGPECPQSVIVRFEIESRLQSEIWHRFDWSIGSSILINNLALPEALIRIIVNGQWKVPPEERLFEVFGDNSSHGHFLAPDQMERSTDQLYYLYEEGYGDGYAVRPSLKNVPTMEQNSLLDLSKAICLGDTGPEGPFCLDYRRSDTRPSVVYLTGGRPYWKIIAPDFETFANRLRL